MKGVFILLRKELYEMFTSPLIYILTALLSALLGWLFYNYLIASPQLYEVTLSDSVVRPLFGNMNFIFLFLCPLITMRLFAEERKQHTLELLFLSRLTDGEIIFAKFLSALLTSSFMLSFTLLFPIILNYSGFSDWGLILSNYMGILLSLMAYTSVGLFASSLTKNQILAAITSFCILMGLILLVITAQASHNYILGLIFEYISVPFHFESFSTGLVKSYNVIYFISFCSFFLYATAKSLDARRW